MPAIALADLEQATETVIISLLKWSAAYTSAKQHGDVLIVHC